MDGKFAIEILKWRINMVRNKIISLGMAALLSVNGLWDASPAFYESMVASAKTATQTKAPGYRIQLIGYCYPWCFPLLRNFLCRSRSFGSCREASSAAPGS